MSNETITIDSIIQRNKEIIDSTIDEEVVMMSMKNGKYYGSGAVGRRIWELLESSASVAVVLETLTNEYNVDPHTCESDVFPFLIKMLSEGLIHIVHVTQP